MTVDTVDTIILPAEPIRAEPKNTDMKTTIQENETTILETSFPSKGFVVVTVTAGSGLSPDLQSFDGQRRSDLLVHNKVFRTFRDPRLAKLYFSVLAAEEVNTDHWRKPSQEGGDWFLLKQYHAGSAKKFWNGVFPEEDDDNPEEPEVSEYEKVSYDHDDYWN